jgi:hypothetical protein
VGATDHVAYQRRQFVAVADTNPAPPFIAFFQSTAVRAKAALNCAVGQYLPEHGAHISDPLPDRTWRKADVRFRALCFVPVRFLTIYQGSADWSMKKRQKSRDTPGKNGGNWQLRTGVTRQTGMNKLSSGAPLSPVQKLLTRKDPKLALRYAHQPQGSPLDEHD